MHINRQLGEFVLLRRLAVGGQSEVFLAMKQGPDHFTRPVVIKALPTKYRHDPKFVELFYREAFLSARFSHPNVITVHDARLLRGEHCMIMDFVNGQTVADIAQRGHKNGRPPTLNQTVQIIADACDGLHYTHEFRDLDDTAYSVVHRDVSPQNLMVTYQGVTKVFDFGIAKIQENGADHDTLAGGKYAYMSPEQCLDEAVDARSDIFSLGIILYELTSGRRLFRRASKEEVVAAVTDEPIDAPTQFDDEYPPLLEEIVLKSLERDPTRRYQSAAEMRDELLQFLATRSDGRVRHQLGKYVSELFTEERADIAKTVRRASEGELDPKPIGNIALEKLGHADAELDAEELEVPMPEPEQDAALAAELVNDGGSSLAETAEVDRSKMIDARKKNRRLADEVHRLQRRQNLLVALLGIVALLAAGLAMYHHLDTTQQEAEPIEIGNSRE
ncbi:MAG: serine/threonine-protein kinase [Persicimonas sp.]